MKQTKWLISLSACLVLMAASSAGVKGKLAIPCQAWEQGSIDTIPLPSRIYSIGKEDRFDPVALFAAILL